MGTIERYMRRLNILAVIAILLLIVFLGEVAIKPRSNYLKQPAIVVPDIGKGIGHPANDADPLKLFIDSLTADSNGSKVYDQVMKKMPWMKDSIRYFEGMNDNSKKY
jgi:hypothetical protein